MKRAAALLGFVFIAAIAGCPAKETPLSPPAVTPGATVAAPAGGGDKCYDACLQRNQARAVSADMIAADCKRQCGESCLASCRARTQMRAVSPDVIESDCKRSCGI